LVSVTKKSVAGLEVIIHTVYLMVGARDGVTKNNIDGLLIVLVANNGKRLRLLPPVSRRRENNWQMVVHLAWEL
jgi:hypothetical protein